MRIFLTAASIASLVLVVAVAATSSPAEARCRVWEATHNGAGMFYSRSGGAAGTAANKLIWQVEQWQQQTGIKKVKIGKISTACGSSFVKYLLPHKHCTARTRVCY